MSIPGFTAEASLYRTSRFYSSVRPRDPWEDTREILPQLARGWGGLACNEACKALCEIQCDLDEQDCWDNFRLYDCVEDAERKLERCLDNCGCGPIIAARRKGASVRALRKRPSFSRMTPHRLASWGG
jgi:hypothetical protein